jgi:hypothetical protein
VSLELVQVLLRLKQRHRHHREDNMVVLFLRHPDQAGKR